MAPRCVLRLSGRASRAPCLTYNSGLACIHSMSGYGGDTGGKQKMPLAIVAGFPPSSPRAPLCIDSRGLFRAKAGWAATHLMMCAFRPFLPADFSQGCTYIPFEWGRSDCARHPIRIIATIYSANKTLVDAHHALSYWSHGALCGNKGPGLRSCRRG